MMAQVPVRLKRSALLARSTIQFKTKIACHPSTAISNMCACQAIEKCTSATLPYEKNYNYKLHIERLMNGKRYGHRHENKKQDHAALVLPLAVLLAAVGADEPLKKNSENDEVLELLQKGRKMMRTKCSREKVEEVYTKALHIALSMKDHGKIALVQDQLANLALRTGQLEKAEVLFKNVIQNLLSGGRKESDPAILEISLKLSTIYASSKKFVFADSGYTWVIETSRNNLKEMEAKDLAQKANKDKYNNQLALLGMTLDSYGRYLFYRGKNQEALTVTREAASVCVKLFGEKDIRTLILYNDIGIILDQVGKGDEAVAIIKKAIALSKGSAEHRDIAVFWTNLAKIYQSQGANKEAKSAFEKAAREAELSRDLNLVKQIKAMSDSDLGGEKASK